MKTFELNYDQIDSIIVNELKEWHSRLISDYHSGVAVFDTQEQHRKMIDAIATTLSFCMEHESYKLYMKHNTFDTATSVDLGSGVIKIVDIIDNPDGSANVIMDMDMEVLKKFAGQAILKALIDAAKKVVDDQ